MKKNYSQPIAQPRGKIVAVIVTYHPDVGALTRLLLALRDQVDLMVIVDNGSDIRVALDKLLVQFPSAIFIGLQRNMGIAFAQNVGIREANCHDALYVLTLDQDSVPTVNMVQVLAGAFGEQTEERKIAVVGPLLKDETTQQYLPLFTYCQGHKKRIIPASAHETVDVDFIVSSGSLIAMSALNDIGLMREELFIAYVDVEWCLRARSRNYHVLACCAATMEHNLGERRLKIGSWLLPLHSPLRHFYLFRSGVYMQRLPYISSFWKRADRRQLARSFILFGTAGLPSLAEVTHMYRGFIAGIKMKVLPFPIITKINEENKS